MRHARLPWAVVIAVVVTVAALPVLRKQLAMQWRAVTRPDLFVEAFTSGKPVDEWVRFVERRYPRDPKMLTAVGCVAYQAGLREIPEGAPSSQSRTLTTALRLLRAGAEAGGGPAAWAAYANALGRDFWGYPRVGETGNDPTDAEQRLEAEKEATARPAPPVPPERTGPPVLRALHEWEKADPANGLPVALEAYVLYGLRRDKEALERWKQAARFPEVHHRRRECIEWARLLYERIGFTDIESDLLSRGSVNQFPPVFAWLRGGARIAVYEGRLAMMRGEKSEAVRLWDATIRIGRQLEQSADSASDWLAGGPIAAIGLSPTWVWVPDRASDLSGGPVYKGRCFWGRQHAFCVSQVGQAADGVQRDQAIQAKLRQAQLGSLLRRSLYSTLDDLGLPLGLSAAAMGLAVQTASLTLLFLIGSSWARQRADAATGLRTGWKVLITILLLASILPGVLGALIAAKRTRTGPYGVLASWRGNLRKSLPLAAALSALLCLAANIGGAYSQEKLARALAAPEMTRLVRAGGPSWANPKIPPDAWRAAFPPTPRRK